MYTYTLTDTGVALDALFEDGTIKETSIWKCYQRNLIPHDDYLQILQNYYATHEHTVALNALYESYVTSGHLTSAELYEMTGLTFSAS